ncbi:MAG: DUF5077 domain-containing protein, partial [Planctomycetes bacterium]|nr:DUF5077 domain-containing protein [Planctomycetota bacterium]
MQNLIATTSFLLLCLFPITETQASESQSWTIPAAGNSFQSQANSTGRRRNGGAFLNLTDADTVLSLYFHVDRPAKIEIDVEAKGGTDATHLVAIIGAEERKLSVRGDAFASHSVGTLNVQQAGYVRV